MDARQVVAPLLLFLAGCSDPNPRRLTPHIEYIDGVEVATLESVPSPLDPEYFWSFETVSEIRTWRPGDDEPLVFNPRMVVRLRDGRLFVHDPTAERPLVLLEAGSWDATSRFGRTGGGPGEVGSWLSLAELEDGSLAVLDSYNRRLHHYSAEGEVISSVRLGTASFVGKPLFAARRDYFVVETMNSTPTVQHRALARVPARSGEVLPLHTLPVATTDAQPGMIQRGRAVWTQTQEGSVAMWSAHSTLEVYDHQGTLTRRIRLPLSPRRLSAFGRQSRRRHRG